MTCTKFPRSKKSEYPKKSEKFYLNYIEHEPKGPRVAKVSYNPEEKGPELIIPQSAGTVIPNHALGAMGSGGTQIVYNGPYIANMQAIDTQSGIQFLSKNKQAVWSANQSAQRSLPQSR